MSAMTKFIGVDCKPCRRVGHKCQAQMMTDEGPMCLRCANDEPCFAVTAPLNFETPARMRNDDGYEGMVHRSGSHGERYGMSGAA